MTRTYGTLHHLKPKEGADKSIRPAWGLDCEPQVAMRLKRVFARVQQNRSGLLTITDTPEVARDLEWFLQRYPMEMREPTAVLLAERAELRRRQEETVLSVLGGQMEVELPEGMEPARPLYDFQRQAADLVLASRRLLLTDDVGLGKTTSAIGVFRHPDALPAVFVTLTHLPEQMRDEMAVVLPWLTGYAVTRGQPHDLSKARGNGGRFPDVVFLSYSKLANWAPALAGVARTVVYDEMQELRHDGTHKYVAAGMIADQAQYVMGLTATPVYNYGGEIFNVMNVLAPDALGTREEFTREWGAGVTSSGQVRVKDPGALGHYLTEQGLMLGRTRKDVGRELPPVVTIEQTVAADLRTLEGGMAETADLAELLLDPTTEAKDRFLMAGQLDYKLRHATGVAKAPFVAEFVRLLLESEDKVVLYLWHHDVYDEIAARLEKAGHRTLRYSGKESPNQKREAKAAFVLPSDQGGARVLMMSLRAGAGLDGLQQVCSCVVFGELDWSPGRHVQAIGRVARDGQENPVAAYFLHSEDGSDPVILPVLNTKAMQSEPIVRPDEDRDAKITPDVSAQRMRMLAKAVLQRQGRPVPMALEREPDADEVAELFPATVPEFVVDQLDLFGADS